MKLNDKNVYICTFKFSEKKSSNIEDEKRTKKEKRYRKIIV